MHMYGTRTLLWWFLLVAMAASVSAQDSGVLRWTADQESGVVFSGYNDARIPGNTGTRFSLTEDLDTESKLYYRLTVRYILSRKHTISGTFAPLTLSVSGAFNRSVLFQGAAFPADSLIEGEYQFASYRLTYRYDFFTTDTWELGAGATVFLRDAAIRLRGAGQSAAKENRGFVPLLHFRARRILSPVTSIILEGDALAAPQGRAEDVLLAVQYHPLTNFGLKFGYRIIEGGADTDEVYTFALLHYAVVGAYIAF